MSVEKQIAGAEDLSKAFKEFGPKFENRVMRAAMNAGAAEFVKLAKSKARTITMSATGRRRLRQAISFAKIRKSKGKLTGGMFVRSIAKPRIVKGRKVLVDDPFVWSRWFDEGTEPRFRGKRSKSAKQRRTGRRGYTGQLKAQPFLTEAFLEGADKALATFSTVAAKRVTQHMKREARRKARGET